MSVAIPFFARKIKEISQYFVKKRKELKKDFSFVKRKGSDQGLVDSIKNELLDLYSGDDAAETLTIPTDIGSFIDNISIEIENTYDTFNDYYDLDPSKPPAFYDTLSGNRFDYFTSNTNEISGAFFYDTEKAIKDIINTQGTALKEIPSLTVNFDSTDISNLPRTFFQDYRNTGASNLKYILQAELVEKFMGTDMYFVSSNSSKQVLSGKMFDAKAPHANLLNINNPGIIQVPGGEYKSEREVGLFFKPVNHGILKIDAEFEPVFDKRSIEPDTVYMYPDPTRYSKIFGVGESERETPFIFILKNKEFKNNSSSYGKSLVKSNSDDQNFYSYSSLQQDNFAQNNLTPFYGIESGELSGNISKKVGDIYGNIFFLVNPTTISNKNLYNFTPTETPLDYTTTQYVTLTADERETINIIKNKTKNISVYNTLKDSYEAIQTSLSGVFNKYIYDSNIFNELNNSIIDIDIFKNTFFIRTTNYLITDNIIYNDDGTFASKVFVSRVKKVDPVITTTQDKTQISNLSNPVRLGQNIFSIKAESSITTPINARTFNFSIFKYNLDTLGEINIIDENTTNRSYFADNFTFDVGSNITQIKNMKLSYNSKQNKFFLLTDLADLNNTSYYHILVFEILGNKLTLNQNFVLTPDNDSLTSNFYALNELQENFTTQSLSSTPTQIRENGTLNF